MPILSRFFGIILYMYWRDHAPPHFHAKYGGDEITIEILTGNVAGTISKRALLLIQEWRELHIAELLEDWKLAEQNKSINEIPPKYPHWSNSMFLHVVKAEYIGDYVIKIQFNNGEGGTIDLKDKLYGEIFEPLKDINKFKKFHIDPELETVVWENGADLAPEFLYENMKKAA